jgi:hypothetical protein
MLLGRRLRGNTLYRTVPITGRKVGLLNVVDSPQIFHLILFYHCTPLAAGGDLPKETGHVRCFSFFFENFS